MAGSTLRIATRRSQLAMVQTHGLARLNWPSSPPGPGVIKRRGIGGPRRQDSRCRLAKIGGQGPVTKELGGPECCSIGLILLSTASRTCPTNLPEVCILACITERDSGRCPCCVHAKASGQDPCATLARRQCGGTAASCALGQLPSPLSPSCVPRCALAMSSPAGETR